MGNMINEEIIEKITEILPAEWEEKSVELGAYGRSRKIKSAVDLLILVLLYVTSGKSIGGTSTILKSSGKGLNKNAVKERLQKSVEWVKWLIENICVMGGYIVKRPEWLEYRRVMAVDGTKEGASNEAQTQYNLHYMTDLFTLECIEAKVTDYETGEKLTNFEDIGQGDIVVGDRAYGTLKSIEYAVSKGADYVIRLKANAFNLYDEKGEKVDLAKKIRRMNGAAYKVFDVYYKVSGELKPTRICVYRKDATNIKESAQKASKTQKFYDKYVIVATSLNESPDKILELYRLRWQIELLFKRLKSIFALDELRAKTSESVKLWFYCKLLLAAICETLDNMGRFSPSIQFSFGMREQIQ